MEVVDGYFRRWMERYPTLEALAAAPLDDLLKQWEGLGYDARWCVHCMPLHNGLLLSMAATFPKAARMCAVLPAFARTVGAILSIAFGQAEPLLDGNVKCVLMWLETSPHPLRPPPHAAACGRWRGPVWRKPPRQAMPACSTRRASNWAQRFVYPNGRGLLCPIEAHCLARQRGTDMECPACGAESHAPRGCGGGRYLAEHSRWTPAAGAAPRRRAAGRAVGVPWRQGGSERRLITLRRCGARLWRSWA